MVRHLTQLERIRRWVNDNKALALLFDIKYKGTHLGNDAARFRGGMTTARRKPRALQRAVHVANGNVRIGGGPSMVRDYRKAGLVHRLDEIGRASGRERVGESVWITVAACALKRKKQTNK